MTPTARRWLRTLRTIRRRVRDTAPPPSRFLLIVTPTDPACNLPLHAESGGEHDSDHWALLDRGGEVVRRKGVPCLVTVHDLDETDPDSATVVRLWLDAHGDVASHPPGADEPDGGPHEGGGGSPDAEVDYLPVVQAGEPCPECGGGIVVDGARRYAGVPIYADGTPTGTPTAKTAGGGSRWTGERDLPSPPGAGGTSPTGGAT